LTAALPDLRTSIRQLVADGAGFAGSPPTGRAIGITGPACSSNATDLVVEAWDPHDLNALQLQFHAFPGAVPRP
jgi:hypothetical protein